jgi:RNA polymerase sigma-70 factor (ECF subfamily)
VQDDDREAVGELYERYGHLVLGLCLNYLKNKDDAREATLTIFGKLLGDLKKHKINYFKSWLYAYSKNFCLMELRKRQSRLKKELDLDENTALIMDFNEAEHLHSKENQILLLESAMAFLSEEQRICIELFYLKERSYKEIAELTGHQFNEVKSYIQNGKRNLKIQMEKILNEQEGK